MISKRRSHHRVGVILSIVGWVVAASVIFVSEGAAQSVAAAAKKRRAESTSQARPKELSGEVVETMDGGGYTYVRIRTASGETWAAIPQTTVQVGSSLSVYPQVTFEKFESKALKRTFDRILFATVIASPPPQTAHPSVTAAASHMSAGQAEVIRVEKARGGRTVAELWASRKELQGTAVIVRGKVVKSVQQVMSRNWVHLRDGSGSQADGTDDITLTTSEAVPAGAIVTFHGTLRIDKDFGAGYRYAVIIEDAVRMP